MDTENTFLLAAVHLNYCPPKLLPTPAAAHPNCCLPQLLSISVAVRPNMDLTFV